MKKLILLFAILPFLSNGQDDFKMKHRMFTVAPTFMINSFSNGFNNPPNQFGLIFKNIVKGSGLYAYGNKANVQDDFKYEYQKLNESRGSIGERQYEINKRNLDDRAGEQANLTYVNVGVNHNLYYYTKVPVVISAGANIIRHSGSISSETTKTDVNLNAGINIFIPSKKRVEIGFVGDFTFSKKVYFYYGVCIGLKLGKA